MELSTVLSVFLGGLITIGTTLWVERLRKPKLRIVVGEPHDREYPGGSAARHARFLGVEVTNVRPAALRRWLSRDPALRCRGQITFHRQLDGHRLFSASMSARFSGSPEPLPLVGVIGQERLLLFDPLRISLDSMIDIHAGESQRLDLAGRFDNELACYAWNNESYFCDPPWRNPARQIERGCYLLRIEVTAATETASAIVRLVNDVPRSDFRLEPATPEEQARVEADKN